jgi:hypothetical protein
MKLTGMAWLVPVKVDINNSIKLQIVIVEHLCYKVSSWSLVGSCMNALYACIRQY